MTALQQPSRKKTDLHPLRVLIGRDAGLAPVSPGVRVEADEVFFSRVLSDDALPEAMMLGQPGGQPSTYL